MEVVTMRTRSMALMAASALVAVVWLGQASAQGATGTRPSVAQGATATSTGTGVGVASASSAVASPVPAIAPLPWCCPAGGAAAGVTATGQAFLRGQGPSVRDAAIRAAVADATSQATAAADAAGITLGQIVSMQVSAPGFALPMEGVAPGATASGGGVAGSPTVMCPGKTACPPLPTPIPVPLQTFVTVTITWAIA
jgi:hypothetical protein